MFNFKNTSTQVMFICLLNLTITLCSASKTVVLPFIVNYSNHTDLKKAMEYDLTMDPDVFLKKDGTIDRALYVSYTAKADRNLAEKHYLDYLKDVNEPFQRARVYNKLMKLYSGAVSHHVVSSKGVDPVKAAMYARKVLEEEPNGICEPTLNARGRLISDPKATNSRFERLMDYYEYLLSINKDKVRENWVPLRPGGGRPSDGAVAHVLDNVKERQDTAASNLVLFAKTEIYRPYPRNSNLNRLHKLIRRFPDTMVAKRAKLELDKVAK